ncbi:hypothetical protein EV2_026628 [Malus domestica]
MRLSLFCYCAMQAEFDLTERGMILLKAPENWNGRHRRTSVGPVPLSRTHRCSGLTDLASENMKSYSAGAARDNKR